MVHIVTQSMFSQNNISYIKRSLPKHIAPMLKQNTSLYNLNSLSSLIVEASRNDTLGCADHCNILFSLVSVIR